jgi:ribonucleoside-diphosphate reductase subunit M1
MYYLRSRPAADPIKFTVDVELLLKSAGEIIKKEEEGGIRERTNSMNENEEWSEKAKKKVKVNEEMEMPVKVCPMRRKGAPEEEECMACGS